MMLLLIEAYLWTELAAKYRGVEIFEKSQKGGSRFSWKMAGGNHIGRGVYRRGGHCFPLMMYRFCSNNALHPTSPSFTIFFSLTPFDTWSCNYLKSNLSLATYINVLLRKSIYYCFKVFWTWRNNFPSCVYFCVYSVFYCGRYCQKNILKSGGWEKDIKGDDRIGGGCVYRRSVCGEGSKLSAHYVGTFL